MLHNLKWLFTFNSHEALIHLSDPLVFRHSILSLRSGSSAGFKTAEKAAAAAQEGQVCPHIHHPHPQIFTL